MDHGAAPTGAAPNMADDQCNCTTAHIDPNCYCPPDSPKGRASSGGAAAPHALTHSHESLGSFTRNLSAMSLDDSATPKPPGRVSPDFRGSEGHALTQAARTLSNISADAGVAPASAPAPYAPLAPPSAPAPWPPAAAPRPAAAAAAPPWAPAPASAPAPWPPATSPRYRATDEALRRERALTFDESDGHAMKVDACDACPYCHDTCADPDCPRCAVWRLRPRKCVEAAPSSRPARCGATRRRSRAGSWPGATFLMSHHSCRGTRPGRGPSSGRPAARTARRTSASTRRKLKNCGCSTRSGGWSPAARRRIPKTAAPWPRRRIV